MRTAWSTLPLHLVVIICISLIGPATTTPVFALVVLPPVIAISAIKLAALLVSLLSIPVGATVHLIKRESKKTILISSVILLLIFAATYLFIGLLKSAPAAPPQVKSTLPTDSDRVTTEFAPNKLDEQGVLSRQPSYQSDLFDFIIYFSASFVLNALMIGVFVAPLTGGLVYYLKRSHRLELSTRRLIAIAVLATLSLVTAASFLYVASALITYGEIMVT